MWDKLTHPKIPVTSMKPPKVYFCPIGIRVISIAVCHIWTLNANLTNHSRLLNYNIVTKNCKWVPLPVSFPTIPGLFGSCFWSGFEIIWWLASGIALASNTVAWNNSWRSAKTAGTKDQPQDWIPTPPLAYFLCIWSKIWCIVGNPVYHVKCWHWYVSRNLRPKTYILYRNNSSTPTNK